MYTSDYVYAISMDVYSYGSLYFVCIQVILHMLVWMCICMDLCIFVCIQVISTYGTVP
jgi:hypothetical protein